MYNYTVHSTFYFLNFMLPACRPNYIEVVNGSVNLDQRPKQVLNPHVSVDRAAFVIRLLVIKKHGYKFDLACQKGNVQNQTLPSRERSKCYAT
jgi:hypothetical protein